MCFVVWVFAFVVVIVLDIHGGVSLLGDVVFFWFFCVPLLWSGVVFTLPLFWGGVVLVGSAVPSSIGVVLFSPLKWFCFLIHPSLTS